MNSNRLSMKESNLLQRVVLAAITAGAVSTPMISYALEPGGAPGPNPAPNEGVWGIVTDSDMHTLPGAAIYIDDNKVSILSGLDGRYVLSNLEPGTHTLRVSYVGFKPVTKTITVKKGEVNTLDISMNEGTE